MHHNWIAQTVLPDPEVDWEAEQERLRAERDQARDDLLRLEPGPELTTPEDLENFGTAIERSREAEERWSVFLEKRRTRDPAWT